ncbi:HEAT repeat domain-containing protein [Falsibacillus albus]|uniref:HEAT repeat domain-containing protein n=1 Tax=Falsibacillus albus TaxID=2478915 RepID=A0A3L7K169_9BACI|nr:HEAT repeat domain-containing protein [Falsibacillus albus]RLQ96139.1 HEAT repeat domain-containing protein [Falsibacillus albus]
MLQSGIFAVVMAAVVILAILSVLLLYLIIRKYMENKTMRKIEIEKDRMNPLLYTYISEGNITRELSTESLVKKRAIENLLRKYSEILVDVQAKLRIEEMAQCHLSTYYVKELNSRQWSKRMNALYHIEDFKLTSLQQPVMHCLQKNNAAKEEKFVCLRILAAFQMNGIHDMLTNEYTNLSDFEYRSILMKLNENHFEFFIAGFHRMDANLQYAVLEVMGVKKEINYVPFLESVFQANKGELRLRALKALASIGYVKDPDKYSFLSRSESWQERMMAAKLFGVVKEESFLTALKDLLHDRSWYVRSQAGQAMTLIPKGYQLLHQILENSEDPFARDMAWEWINKGES